MKAISLWQPWATLIAIVAKTIETRHWSTPYRGLLLIHAAQTKQGIKECQDLKADKIDAALRSFRFPDGGGYSIYDWSRLPFGAFVCIVNLDSIIRTEDYQWTTGTDQRPFGNFAPGRFGWVLNQLEPLDKPIPARGYQGLWHISRQEQIDLGLIKPFVNRDTQQQIEPEQTELF